MPIAILDAGVNAGGGPTTPAQSMMGIHGPSFSFIFAVLGISMFALLLVVL